MNSFPPDFPVSPVSSAGRDPGMLHSGTGNVTGGFGEMCAIITELLKEETQNKEELGLQAQ